MTLSLDKGTKLGRLRSALLELWQKHTAAYTLPTSARFLYYELVAAGAISKTAAPRTDGKKGRRSDQDPSDTLTDLREHGLIPWEDNLKAVRQGN